MSKNLWLLRILEARHARTGAAMEASELFYRSVLRAIEAGSLETFLQFPH